MKKTLAFMIRAASTFPAILPGPEREARARAAFTRAYTSSFYAGMKLLNRAERKAIYAIYGFVRVADEIVDIFPA